MMFVLSTFNIITDSILAKSVSPKDTGVILGLCASIPALLRSVGPPIGGILYQNYGVPSFGCIQFMACEQWSHQSNFQFLPSWAGFETMKGSVK
nr:PREDICTED: solute carrier family 22 member 18 [Latimeria chalumnae]|eukprot:XP_014344863.1 PREDICTED: solute carrier family 22 member 18 [Latimeria chalumnae]